MQCLQSALHQLSDLVLFRRLAGVNLAYLLKVTKLGTRWNSLMNFFNYLLINKLLHLSSRHLEFTCCSEVLVHILIESWRSIVSFRTFLDVDIESIEDGVFQSWLMSPTASNGSRRMCLSCTLVIIWLLARLFLLVQVLTCLLRHRSDNTLLGNMCDALCSIEMQIWLVHSSVVLRLSRATIVLFKFRLDVLKLTLFGWFANTWRFLKLLLLLLSTTILLSELISDLFLNLPNRGTESDLLSLIVAELLLHLLPEALMNGWFLSDHVNIRGFLVRQCWIILIHLVAAKVVPLLLTSTAIVVLIAVVL